ncbi:hypothetical protein D9619_005145 [Psilocybe cf. subviscida]|uniref:Nephrocystin 3-like N-terminal domain-containing protein n=1 Tax=Psilocybe cf. subviscida TaxID=2480587 RepID=A0A8H5BPG9_9AGAR|nr:hypothetical protein D9619_005145 [Psilocybe cf. subviscida]
MSHSCFNNSQVQINGDFTLVSTSGSMQDDPSFFHVSQRVQAINAHSQTLQRGFEILCQNTTPAALYGSSPSAKDPGCLHGTRVDIQDYIVKWLGDLESEVAMWMYGSAGVGKTAIAQTVAKSCADRWQLSSAFFFFRSDDGRNSVKHLVATLAFEIQQQMPHTREAVCTPTATNPLIFSTSLERQIKTIILPALSQPFPSMGDTPSAPMLLIIDGLDECKDTGMQQSIIRLFVSSLAATTTAIRHKILIVSRPESQIVSTFSSVDIARHVHHLRLDDWKSIADIKIYLRAELKEVRQTHPLRSYLNAEWPSDNWFNRLLDKSFGSFAYASSAIRYISSHDRNPDSSLHNLVGLTPDRASKAHAELDSLYRHILESLDEKTCYTVRMILCLYEYLGTNDVATLSSLLGKEKSIIELAIIKVSSVIQFEKHRISYYHTSFNDFLQDQERSGALYLYTPDVATKVAKAISKLWMHPDSEKECYSLGIVGCQLWQDHIHCTAEMNVYILEAFLASHLPTTFMAPNNLSSKFAHSLGEFLANIGGLPTSKWSSTPVKLLSHKAFKHAATWLHSQFGQGTHVLENMLDAICFFDQTQWTTSQADTNRRFFEELLFHTVRHDYENCSDICGSFWDDICQFLPGKELEICIGMVKRYAAIEHHAYRTRTLAAYTNEKSGNLLCLTFILTHAIKSQPAGAELCHLLETFILEAMLATSGQFAPYSLISWYLDPDDHNEVVEEIQDPNYGSDIAHSMDSYIRKELVQ